MSLAIDVDKVQEVLLADGWHAVAGHSFSLDSYEYLHQDFVLLGGGQVEGISSLGATWRQHDGATIVCPLTAILAVKWWAK